MKPLNYKQVVAILTQNDFVLVRQRGSHHIYKHSQSGRIAPVPLHPGKSPLKTGTFLAIVKQSGINPKEFTNKPR